MVKMKLKLTAVFIGILWFQNCRKHLRSSEAKNSLTRIGFSTLSSKQQEEVPVLHEFQNSLFIRAIQKAHWCEIDSA